MKRQSAGFLQAGRYCSVAIFLICVCSQTFAQVDVEHRRTLALQSGHSVRAQRGLRPN